MQTLGHVALLARDYDEALAFYTQTLNFRLIEDTRLGEDKRWVLIGPPGSQGTTLLLARAATPEQASRIGNQTGGRVFLFLHTYDFWRELPRNDGKESEVYPAAEQRNLTVQSPSSRTSTAINGICCS